MPVSHLVRIAPAAAAIAAGAPLWPWLWNRWFGVGGERYYGYLFFALSVFALTKIARGGRSGRFPEIFPLSVSSVSFAACVVLFPHIPKLMSAGVYFSALYCSFVSSVDPEERPGMFALWPLLLLSLPHVPSLQFVMGYPLRVAAAHISAALIPGVYAVGCGLGDGKFEVFVDAPCAGAGMLSGMLALSAGAALLFRQRAAGTFLMLAAGTVSALFANAIRAALLYAGHSGMLPIPFQSFESAVGIFCYAAGGFMLTLAACRMNDGEVRGHAASHPASVPALIAHAAVCAAFALIWTTGASAAAVAARSRVAWPESWEGRALVPVNASAETENFWRGFPGEYREFLIVPEERDETPGPYDRAVLRFTREATRRLHPAEDCFRGAGYRIKSLPLELDGGNIRWSGFECEKSGARYRVRQCVISVPGNDLSNLDALIRGAVSWPDVSSWYWDTARPFSDAPPTAVAITIIYQTTPAE
jgi:exosortase/archaeosortase family protein